MFKTILVGGGAGFIGSHYVDLLLSQDKKIQVVVFDALTYAGNLDNLVAHHKDPRFHFVRGDIAHKADLEDVFKKNPIDAIVNFAAESHVDRSHLHPENFLKTNIEGVFNLLEIAKSQNVRYVQVSTDEVYGQVLSGESHEGSALDPRSPYSSSKAAGDLLCRSYHATYGVDVLVTRGSNTYGPRQYPEKMIPLMTTNALLGEKLPVYGDGKQVRDWIHATDHARAIDMVLNKGKAGEIYNIGGGNSHQNIEIINLIIKTTGANKDQILHISDRAGHDARYHVSAQKIHQALGWQPHVDFTNGIIATIKWYMQNKDWWEKIRHDQEFKDYYQKFYDTRLKEAAQSS